MSGEDAFHLGVKALIRNHEGEVLLLQVNTAKLHNAREAYWDLPGGRVQKGSTIEATLKREVLEETGIAAIANIQPVRIVLSTIRIPISENNSVGLILSIYACTIPDNAAIVLSYEHIAYQWFTPKVAAELLHVKYPKDFCDTIAQLS